MPGLALVHCPLCLLTMLLNVGLSMTICRRLGATTATTQGQTDLLPAAIGYTRDFAPQMIRSNNSGS